MAHLNGKRIGINVFASKTARDTWLSTAENLGVAPLEEGAVWVAYNAESQTGAACS
jgi:hypothetical protein